MLKTALIANAVSCSVFGLIFVFLAPETSKIIGSPDVLTLQIVGAGFIVNAGFLIASALQNQPSRNSILFYVLGDAAWVGLTAFLLIFGIWITTPAGVIWSICVAVLVGFLGWLQWRYAPT